MHRSYNVILGYVYPIMIDDVRMHLMNVDPCIKHAHRVKSNNLCTNK